MNKIRKKIYNFLRWIALKEITNNLGRVEETKDKIICYVKKNKCRNERYQFTIPCFGQRKKNKELAEIYELDKPICYVIEGIEVKNKKVYIFGYDNPEIIIKNCTFLFDLYGHVNGKCTIENSFVRAFSLFMFGANELTVKDMCITNPFSSSNTLKIALGGEEKLEIISSTIGKEKQNTNVDLIARDNILIKSSNIGANTIELKAKNINSDKDSKIKASEKIKIDAKEYDNLNITSKESNINGTQYDTGKNEFTLRKIADAKELQKAKLIDTLRKIKEKCEQVKRELLEQYTKDLEEESIHKLVK